MVCFVVLMVSLPGLPMVWDEGNAILRAQQIGRGQWLYTTQLEGHPALYGIVIHVGQRLGDGWLAPLAAARLGPMLLFSLAIGAMFYRLARDYSLSAATVAAATVLLLPRLFAHAHFASIDGPLTSCWLLAWATFPSAAVSLSPSCRRSSASQQLSAVNENTSSPSTQLGRSHWTFWLQVVVWGAALGVTLSSKATGWIAPLPFVLWALAYRRRGSLTALAVGLPVALLTFVALNPPLWHDTLRGLETFFRLNLDRRANPGLNISTWFLGRMYNLDHPLPWYNTLVWTAITVPLPILALLVVGLGSAFRHWRDRPLGMLLVGQWAVLLVVRALPGVPPHDGVRLFLPSFAFLAALVGLGWDTFRLAIARRWPHAPHVRRTVFVGMMVLLGACSVNLLAYRPQWLSFYNLAVGGLPGATRLGMEPTYWWDGLDRTVVDWLEGNTSSDEAILLAASSPDNLQLLKQWGFFDRQALTRSQLAELPPKQTRPRFRWYVLQRRPSGCLPLDNWLIRHAEPAYRKTLFGVPLIEVYDYDDYRRGSEELGTGTLELGGKFSPHSQAPAWERTSAKLCFARPNR